MTSPPPVINAGRVICTATIPPDIVYTGTNLDVGENGILLSELTANSRLAITQSYGRANDFLLELCDDAWVSGGALAFGSVDDVKFRADQLYRGVDAMWEETVTSDSDIDAYLKDVYEVDPATRWWDPSCSFCGRSHLAVTNLVKGKVKSAMICNACVSRFKKELNHS